MANFVNAASTPNEWSSYDAGNIALISAIPIALGLTEICMAREGGNFRSFMRRSTRPGWAPKCSLIHAILTFLTLMPLGYATYLVIKDSAGLGTAASKWGIIFYSAHAIFALGFLLALRTGCHNTVAAYKVLIAVAALAFGFAYYQVIPCAFWWSLPHIIWAVFGMLYFLHLWSLNRQPSKALYQQGTPAV